MIRLRWLLFILLFVVGGSDHVASSPWQASPGVVSHFDPWMMLAEAFRFDGAGVTAASGTLDEITSYAIVTPKWACRNPRFLYANLWGIEASTNPETLPGNSISIGGVHIYNLATTTDLGAVTFSGLTTTTISNGGFIWSDPFSVTIPANSNAGNYYIQTDMNVQSAGQVYPSYSQSTSVTTSSGGSQSATSQAAKLGTNTITQHLSRGYAPIAMACQGWDGSPVVYVAGDSIAEGKGDTFVDTSRGALGYVARGLDDLGSGRLAYTDWAVAAQSPAPASEGAATNGHYGYRIAMIAALTTINNGKIPFTSIITEHGTNDAGNLPTDNPAFWNILHTNFPGIPVIQTTLTPHTRNTPSNNSSCTAASSDFCWTNTANQIAFSGSYAYPGGAVPTFNSALVGGTTYGCASIGGLSCVDGVIDITAQAYVSSTGDWFSPAFTTTLAAASTSPSTSLSLNACPAIGSTLVLDAGTTSSEAGVTDGGGLIVTSASGSPCSVGLYTSNPTAQNHLINSTVAESYTNSGLHPGYAGAIGISAAIVAAKNSGIIP